MTAITMTNDMINYRMSKLGDVDQSTWFKCREIITEAAKSGHDVWFCWGMGGGEHATGLALDLMVKNEAAGDWVRNYIWVNRARLRLRHVIWEQHITSTVVSPGVRRLMGDRGNTTANHMDHNHVLFFGGSYEAPSTSAKAPTKAEKNDNDPTLSRGDTGDRVLALQTGLKKVYPLYAGELDLDRSFGPDLERAVMEFQRRSGLAVDGRVGPATRAALKAAGIDVNVNVKVSAPAQPARKSTMTVVREVWAGKWGTGAARVKRLKAAGYNPSYIQDLVNKGVGVAGAASDPKRRSVSTIATEVIAGKWGNGSDRVARLKRAGYDAQAVQHEVNRRL